MLLSRRGLLVAGAGVVVTGCASNAQMAEAPAPAQQAWAPATPVQRTAAPPLDPRGLVPRDLREQALAALDRHAWSIPNRDRIYIVNFTQHSAEPRLYELDVISGEARMFHTAHGVGSDPFHSGYAHGFSNIVDSNASSLGVYRTSGMGWGVRHGQNVLLDGLEDTNNAARERAIIVHAADYCEPEWLAREGKLGRSFGCFATSFATLDFLRPRMDEGRLLYAARSI
ncbi:murein L,D-transpeptidase catalytic domain-containing protein [Brevundimonas aveniformis]|uniref:murein L,D-transpeptidase catalytic domain-containing protein n=1 Tax=Brevundimonas aveniformis TaxID=370977 RepID=UPI000491A22E|nr:murein L,D-transpeptidase catalytic domain family protein [Brevundimonas aveniformis]